MFRPGELVLVRNKAVEQSADRKHHPCYLGPFQVIRQTKGGSYVLSELDGAVWRQGVAAFRLLPYISREQVEELNWAEDDDEDLDMEDGDIPEELMEWEDEEDGSSRPVPLLRALPWGDFRPARPSLAANAALPIPAAVGPRFSTGFLLVGAIFFSPIFFSPKLSTDLIVINDGFVLLPRLA